VTTFVEVVLSKMMSPLESVQKELVVEEILVGTLVLEVVDDCIGGATGMEDVCDDIVIVGEAVAEMVETTELSVVDTAVNVDQLHSVTLAVENSRVIDVSTSSVGWLEVELVEPVELALLVEEEGNKVELRVG
jgi:hypothetical protein